MRRELLENKEKTKEKHVVAYSIVRAAILPHPPLFTGAVLTRNHILSFLPPVRLTPRSRK